MSSHKTFRIKRFLARKQKQNRPIPQWIRMKTGNKIRWEARPAAGGGGHVGATLDTARDEQEPRGRGWRGRSITLFGRGGTGGRRSLLGETEGPEEGAGGPDHGGEEGEDRVTGHLAWLLEQLTLAGPLPLSFLIKRIGTVSLTRRLQATTYSSIAHLLSAYYASGGFQPSPEGRQPRSGHSAGSQRRVVWTNPRRAALHPTPSRQVDLRAAQTAAPPGRSAVAPAVRAKSKAEMRRWTEEGGEGKQRGREGNGRWPLLPKEFQKKRFGEGVWEAASAT
ncbi:uncharacterized protein LOC111524099 [Piliocolobus tephrosceles]|uniref:uncharacterized protein LOC111524099 n=1 Tax=Piliocolobus tephrosceles TaxID=591936 RepID=UPI000C2A06DA|nr:uncharacterized protein LOC111524099 [Piliocolobus tephrosceles]